MPGEAGTPGSPGEGGSGGLACWDLNENGQPDLPAEDINGDGLVNVLDCSGGPGGTSLGVLNGRVRDRNTLAGLAAVAIVTDPPSLPVQTDASGSFRIEDVPIGMYNVKAQGLTLDGLTATASAGPVSIVASGSASVDLRLARIPEAMLGRLRAYHTKGKPEFVAANCVLCHTDRKNDVSLSPTVVPFHAITQHQQSCTFCHQESVDFRHGSGGQLRKQVGTSVCRGCHANYPTVP